MFPPAAAQCSRTTDVDGAHVKIEGGIEGDAGNARTASAAAAAAAARFQAWPLPPPTVVVGYQQDWLKVGAWALRHWDKAPFEPYSGHVRDVSYVVIAPRGRGAIVYSHHYHN